MPNRTGEVASKVMGAIKTAKATVEGLSGVFKKLAHEHGEVTGLLMRVKGSSDVEVRRELFPKIRKELLSHEKGEMKVVYPAFRQYSELMSIAEEHDTEAGQLEQMLDEVSALRYDDPAWESSFKKLVELVDHHATEEENEFFPEATRILGKEQTERLLSRYEEAKAETMRIVS